MFEEEIYFEEPEFPNSDDPIFKLANHYRDIEWEYIREPQIRKELENEELDFEDDDFDNSIKNRINHVNVSCDLDCELYVNNEKIGNLQANESKEIQFKGPQTLILIRSIAHPEDYYYRVTTFVDGFNDGKAYCFRLSDMQKEREGWETDLKEGKPDAKIHLAYFHKINCHFPEAIKYFSELEEQRERFIVEIAACHFINAKMIQDPAEYDKCKEILLSEVEKGNERAMYIYGCHILDEDEGFKDISWQEGIKWLEKSSEGGRYEPMERLGLFYGDDNYNTYDKDKTFLWNKKAAEAGCNNSMFRLAGCYLKGIGTEVNATEAYNWTKKAADREHRPSVALLAEFYHYGVVVEESHKLWIRYSCMAEMGELDEIQN